jgi:hypothetical protein
VSSSEASEVVVTRVDVAGASQCLCNSVSMKEKD